MAKYDIGLGDETFMVGRFVNHEGIQRNSPSLRWGHISMLPSEPVYHPSNPRNEQESFLVEVYSLPGYSGSPVFVRPFSSPKLKLGYSIEELSAQDCAHAQSGPWLLGVDWGYIGSHLQALHTGMAGVVPAWRLLDLLNSDHLVEQRRAEQERLLERCRRGGTSLSENG
jgi:hypothetical protein